MGVCKITKVKYPDCDIRVESVVLSGDLIASPLEGYDVILEIDWLILAPDLHPTGQMALQFVNTYENLIPTRGVAQPIFTWTSHHALRWDIHLVESQEGLETEVGPRADLVGAPGVCSLF
ncbi:hypothetical protein M9H77_03198 [Catharanthus roseus]|uniref:Uncharacterized protein n=1 Tax=Catharanthus roseus TaxID=4058 RepID=A0ACC0CAS1_CATRO|nr:hypothetical protein M9H77_03198 [Catharanthus roseus]